MICDCGEAEDTPFQFPDKWTAQSDETFVTEKYSSTTKKFEGQLRQLIFDTDPVEGKRTIELTTGRICEEYIGATKFCTEWTKNPFSWKLARMTVKNDLLERGFLVEGKQHEEVNLSNGFVRSHGEYWIVSKIEPVLLH